MDNKELSEISAFAVADSLDRVGDAIRKCSGRLRNNPSGLQKAISLIYNSTDINRGKVVFTGVGKSAKIGEKLAATFTSTGTPSIFIHSTEALHGDLGIIHPGDCVVALSYSGSTDEVVRVVETIKFVNGDTGSQPVASSEKAVPIIGIGGSDRSSLALLCDAWIDAYVDSELSTEVKAPTISTSVTLALGDSIAILLMRHRGFGVLDFARNHPGGSLGVDSRKAVWKKTPDDSNCPNTPSSPISMM